MELKALDKEFADILVFSCRLISGAEKSYADKEIGLSDLPNFMPALQALGPAVAGASELKLPEGDALDEALALIKVELDFADDALEAKAENVLSIALNLYKVLKK